MICLREDTELKDWHNNFEDVPSKRLRNKLVKKPHIEEAIKKTEKVLDSIHSENCYFADKEILPGFYFFVTRNRGILVAPLHLPRLEIKEHKKDNLFQGATRGLEMFGTETTDGRIVEELQELFEQILKHSTARP